MTDETKGNGMTRAAFYAVDSHKKIQLMYASAKTMGKCAMPTAEWHGWMCGQGQDHDGQCVPSSDEINRMADEAGVDAFAHAMKLKLADARAKGRSGWNDSAECTQERLSEMLRHHVEKGDPRDVANFCMFLYMRGEAIAAQSAMRVDEAMVERALGTFYRIVNSWNGGYQVNRVDAMRAALQAAIGGQHD